MKLEVGMYVRTKYNGIFNIQVLEAIRDINCDYIEINYIRFPRNEILKASYNIGKILEAGDFLDFHCIEKIEGTTIYLKDGWFIDFDDVEDLVGTICTKEQFESMSYKVGE